MPRIAAATVAEHVAHQEAAVIDAAARLFTERGANNVTLGDIAGEVGLKRNSLYRYFPDKGHILAAWFRAELAPLLGRCADIAAGHDDPADQLDAWLTVQLDYLTTPEHQALLAAAVELSSVGDDVRDEIASGHRELYATLSTVTARLVARGDGAARDVPILTMLIVGLLRSAADLIRTGHDARRTRTELLRVAHAVAG